MRIRSTKPEFWRSKTIAELDWDVRFVLKGLEAYVDDNGVGKDDIALIAADVFPRDLSANTLETLARLSEAISTLVKVGLVARYTVDGEDLLYIDRWKSIQRIDKPAKGRYPRPDGTLDYSDDVARESYAIPRDTVAKTPEVVAPGTGEQGNRGTDKNLGQPKSTETVKPDRFSEFWFAYPKKVAKKDAEKRWAVLMKRGEDAEVIIAGAIRYAQEVRGKEPSHIKNPDGWLNGGRWSDQPTVLATARWSDDPYAPAPFWEG